MGIALLLTAPLAVLTGIERPAALVAIVGLGAFAAAVTRVGLWLLDDAVAGNPDAHALRVGSGTFVSATVFAAAAPVLGPATVFLVLPATVLVALWFRPGRGARWLVAA